MATTLVIKDGNFSTNALATVILGDLVPCTGVELDETSITVDYVSSDILTATVTPENTTDILSWSSSDETVATVNNGTIIPTGVGETTITATCGEYSAVCSVTVTANMNTSNLLKRVGYFMSGNAVASGGNGLPTWTSSNAERGGLASTDGTLHFYNLTDIFPYPIPSNTETVKVTIPTSIAIGIDCIEWFNSGTSASASSVTANLLVKSTGLSPTTVDNNVIYSVSIPPNTPTIDMLAIGIKTTDYSSLTDAMLSSITVEFLPSA